MEHIGWLIETEPQYNALYHEMYPVAKIEAEVEVIRAAAERYRAEEHLPAALNYRKPRTRK